MHTAAATPPETVLLIGGAGFIDAHVARELIAHGYRVVIPYQFTAY
jgi:nucleoside-diphosphate-sugar epimerase